MFTEQELERRLEIDLEHLSRKDNINAKSNLNLFIFIILMYPIIWNLWQEIFVFFISISIAIFLILKFVEIQAEKENEAIYGTID